jgi:hypothetical protein
MNAFLHGLAMAPGRTMSFLPHEDSDAHTQLAVQFNQQFVPVTDAERQIIREIVDLLWLARRARDLQTFAIESGDDRKLALYLRYETAHLRAHNAAIKTLLTLQKDRRQRDQHHDAWGEPARPADFAFVSAGHTRLHNFPKPPASTTTSDAAPQADTSFRNPTFDPQTSSPTQPETTPQTAAESIRKEQNQAA